MLSGPKTNDMWYNRLSKFTKDNSVLGNLNLATDGIELGSECLLLKKYSELNPKLLLAVESCNDKYSVTCRLEPEKANSIREAPKLPCLKPIGVGRRKRDSGDHHKKGKTSGLARRRA